MSRKIKMKFCDWNVCFWMILLFPHQMPCLMPKFSSSFSSDSPSFLSSTDVLTRDAIHSLVDFRQQTRKEKIVLDEIIYGIFAPRTFNGTWLSDDELLYRDAFGNLVLMNVSEPDQEQQSKLLVSNYTLVSIL